MAGVTGRTGLGPRPAPPPPATATYLVAGLDPLESPPDGAPAEAWRGQLEGALEAAVRAHGGHVAATEGEIEGEAGAVVARFDSASEGAAAALDLRRALGAGEVQPPLRLGLRLALHTGRARGAAGGRTAGVAVRTAARLVGIARGSQTLVSAPAATELAGHLPPGATLVDLGLHRLRDLSAPLRVYGLRWDEGDDQGYQENQHGQAPLRSLDTVPNTLPVHFTGFVGRQAELAALRAILRDERLVTLTGAGGAGKTRLAAQVAADLSEWWPDGVWWVELGTVTEPQEVAEQVAAAAGVLVEPVRGALRSLTLQLQDRRVLLCLDNCEQVLDGVAGVAAALLRGCPEVTVLTTSREPLGVPGEAVWRVPPLAEEEAVALFVERGSLVRPSFALDAAGEAAVRTMCARLDGLPLALELAAAWLRALTPQQIEAGLDDRFALLVRGARGALPRQQTLAASIDWSHNLLAESDRVVFRRLAVCAGGFDLQGARAVAGGAPVERAEVLDALGRLVDKSLLVAEAREGDTRYRLLETLRVYAAERLAAAGETDATRNRLLDHLLALVEALEPLRQQDMDAWSSRLALEHDNLRAALEWGLAAPDPHRGRRLAGALPWLWHLSGHGREGIAYLRRAIDRAPEERSRLQARLLTGVALVADTASPLDLELDAAQRALHLASEQGDEGLRALCLALSAVGQFYTDFSAAWDLAGEALGSAEREGDALVADAARALQGIILHLRDRHQEAEPLLGGAVEGLLRRHRGIAATALGFQASGAFYGGQIGRARRLAEEAVRVAAPLGDYHRVGSTRSVLALILCLAGDPEAGQREMGPVLRLTQGAEDGVFVPGMAQAMGTLHLRRGQPQQAATWFEREARATDRGAETWLVAQALPGLGAALAALGRTAEAREALERALAVGRRLDLPRVVAAALEQQGHLAAGDDPASAAALHHEALALRVEHGLRTFYADSLEALAALAVGAEPDAAAVRLLAASEAARRALSYPRDPARQPAQEATLTALRGALGRQRFDAAWAEGARMTLDEAVAYVRRSRGARRRPSAGWDSLTPTERDVVRLAAAGLNNPQIGSQLFMSRGTVKTHLTHVFAKLGVANRTELAALAAARATPARRA